MPGKKTTTTTTTTTRNPNVQDSLLINNTDFIMINDQDKLIL